MKTITVTLGGQKFTINELPRKKNADWREQFQAEFSEAADALAGITKADIGGGEDLAKLVRGLLTQVNGAIEKVIKLLQVYAPNVDAALVEEEAYDSELLEAFTGVLGLAYPFGAMLEAVGGIAQLGRKAS